MENPRKMNAMTTAGNGTMNWVNSFDLDCRFLAQVFTENDGELRAGGTGILVSPEHVLTCVHEVLHINVEDWKARKYASDAPPIAIVFGLEQKTERSATLVACADPDMALLHLDKPVNFPPLPFIAGLRANHDIALLRKRPCAIGYVSDQLMRSYIIGPLLAAADFSSQRLVNLQVQQGLLPGMSGGALVAPLGERYVCLGMPYLGGERSPASRVVLADVILAFLSVHKVPFSSPVAAREYLAESLGQLIERRRDDRGFSRSYLATELGVGKETLKNWEEDRSLPAGDHRNRIYEEVIRGDSEAVEQWQQLLAALEGRRPPTDPVAELRALAKPGCLSVERNHNTKTLGLDLETEPLPRRLRLAIGSDARIIATLPWPAHCTFLLAQGMESIPRSYYCLDPKLDLDGPLPQGATALPRLTGPLPVRHPASLNCLLMLARRSGPFNWSKTGTTRDKRLEEEEIMKRVWEIAASEGEQSFGALYEFEVFESDR
jgi:transcriptional regulator with XRE-family HTH domain